MPDFRPAFPFEWARRLCAALALNLLLIGSFSVCAQENVNSNAENTNVNRNANAAANGNTGQPGNTNANQRETPTPSPTPTPTAAEEGRKAKLLEGYWYFILVTGMFAVILLPFAWTITRAIRYSRGTYGPLGLPEGSLRAILAYTLVAYLGFYILASVLSFSNFQPPDFLLGIVATVVGFYFGSRTGEAKDAGGAARAGTVEAEVANATGGPASGATVELTPASGKKSSQQTGPDGKCKFEAVAPGKYTIRATMAGQNPSDAQDVEVKAGATQAVKLQLK